MIAVIGAGASGLCAAIELKRRSPRASVLVLERAARAGRKLSATGNGRCNLSNADWSLHHYHGADPDFALGALNAFDFESTRSFFESIGVPLKREEQKFFPYSLQASAVCDALRLECARLQIEVRTECPVLSLSARPGRFRLATPGEALTAQAVIVACGGAANAPLGGCEDGYALLEALGHRRTALLPAIVQVRTNPEHARALSGVKLDAQAALWVDGVPVRQERGEVLFTDYGLSGPAILQLSGPAVRALSRKKSVEIQLDLLPEMPLNALRGHLATRQEQRAKAPLEQFLVGLVHNRIGLTALKACGLSPLSRPARDLNGGDLNRLADQLKAWRFTVLDSNGMKNAQVTAGGIDTRGFDPATLGSRLCPGLFACGEVLDIDGDCGGYNLQWAWSSGRLAGASSAVYSQKVENA